MKIRYAIVLLLLFSSFTAFGENVRGRIAGTISGTSEGLSFRPEELVVIEAGDVPDLQAGLEIRLDIPAGLSRYQNSFALLVYRSVSPDPVPETQLYRGTRVYMRLLPTRDAMFLRIPFGEQSQVTGDAYTDVLPVPLDEEDFPLMVTILPVMKGVPDSAFAQQCSIRAESLWKNEGTLSVDVANTSGDPEEDIAIFIDGNQVERSESVVVEAGLHRVRITSSHAPSIEQTVAVEPGQRKTLSVELDYRSPQMKISLPAGAVVFLDGEEIVDDGPSLTVDIEPGDHQVTYKLGDFEVSRPFPVLPRGKLTIELIVDIDIVDIGDGTGNQFGAGDGS